MKKPQSNLEMLREAIKDSFVIVGFIVVCQVIAEELS